MSRYNYSLEPMAVSHMLDFYVIIIKISENCWSLKKFDKDHKCMCSAEQLDFISGQCQIPGYRQCNDASYLNKFNL